MLQSYGGSGDTLDYSRIPASYRAQMGRFSSQLPSSGTISREQYRTQFEQRMQEMRSRFGSRGRGGDSGDRSSPFSRGGPPSMGGSSSSNDIADNILRSGDRNGDGRLTPDEVTSNRMRESFQQYDTNRDGALDLNEIRSYMQARFASRGGSSDSSSSSSSMSPSPYPPGGPGNWVPRGNNARRDRRSRDDRNDSRNGFRGPNQPQEDALPVVYRYGKLPKEFPFADLDTDKDGQIGLYEWRHAEKSIKEFTELDLNGDGYLTADEWLRSQRLAAEKKAASGDPTSATSTSTSASTSRGGPFGGNMRGMGRNRGGSNDDRSGRNGRGNRGNRRDRNSSSSGGQ
jgi:Ca2+-binding EF-hand superfamily protein